MTMDFAVGVLFLSFYNVFVPVSPQFLQDLQIKIQSGNILASDLAPLKAQFGIIFLFSLASLVHTLYAGILGLAYLQGIKKWKACIALLLFPILATILLAFALVSLSQQLLQV